MLANLGKLYQKVFSNWCFTSNACFYTGGRIVVAWKPSSFTVNIVAITGQLNHCHVTLVSGMTSFYCMFVYAFNECPQRMELWRDVKNLNIHEALILCGDFNCVMEVDERIGATVRHSDIFDINICMHWCSIEDIKSDRNLYTWNNKQQGAAKVFSKLDRVLDNQTWKGSYSSTEVCFMSEG